MATKKKVEKIEQDVIHQEEQKAKSISASPAQELQKQSEAALCKDEPQQLLAVTLRLDNTYEYHLNLQRSAIEAILDPDVPDTFIEVKSPITGSRRFLHTSYVKEIDVRGL